jgi:cobyrinic acid a,c-diamide synthase
MATPNILGLTTVNGNTTVQSCTTSATAIVENAADSGKIYKINSLIISNIDGTSSADITVDLYRSSTAYHIVKTVAVAADSAFNAIDKTGTIYLLEGDALRCTASADGDLQAVCSFEEMS